MNYIVNEIACVTKLQKEIGIFIERKLCVIADFFSIVKHCAIYL